MTIMIVMTMKKVHLLDSIAVMSRMECSHSVSTGPTDEHSLQMLANASITEASAWGLCSLPSAALAVSVRLFLAVIWTVH